LLKVYPLGHRFNKGRLFNAGVRYIQKHESLKITCLILHDVDLIPEDDGNFYSCESAHPKHTTTRIRQLTSTRGYTRYYEFLIGGVLLLTLDMYKTVNGFSNSYWGWGGEDDDLSLRLIQRRMCVVRPSYELATYVGKKKKSFFFE
jgi:predicted glycosyltransferase involved in capsule biosynthesis